MSISEAVRLAKNYEGDEAASFVNGVLASLIKRMRGKDNANRV